MLLIVVWKFANYNLSENAVFMRFSHPFERLPL